MLHAFRLIAAIDLARPDWVADAACRGLDSRLFFPERGEPTAPAKAICRECPVAEACLEYATHHGERDGIWAGTTGKERRVSRSHRKPIEHGTNNGYRRHLRDGTEPCPACLTAHRLEARWRRNAAR